jgi:ABC-type bacteriocin/lantibiotic exporter with double-glycine peptidase domain
MKSASPVSVATIDALVLEGFGLEVQGRVLLRDLDLSLPSSGVTAVFGASGSGKSTLLKALAGLGPFSGSLKTEPRDLLAVSPELHRRKVQYVHQEPWLFPGTVRENLALPATLKQNRDLDLSETVWVPHMKALGLEPTLLDQDTAKLSGGEKQRLALVRALAMEPAFLLLDEPTSAMDVAAESATMAHLHSLSGLCGVIAVTHSVEVITSSNRVLLLAHRTLAEVPGVLDREAVRRMVE